jgi:MoxR-like ATPase|tara:strand:+ start:162 stop:1358 length:1197 start_codon:yes stop_codon:yes gene_type:complete
MSKVKMNANRTKWVNAVREVLGDVETIGRDDIRTVLDATGMNFPYWQVQNNLKAERGVYYVPSLDGKIGGTPVKSAPVAKAPVAASVETAVAMAPSAIGVMDQQDSYVPEKFEGYVAWGNFNTVKDVIKSGIFYPMFITGLSGNGKTLMVKEVCAKLKREYVRANITVETDEDDLIGGFRLVNGETVWHDGPVVTAMKRGAVLLLDEIDLASNKIMALQPVLEGSSIYLKKIGKWVHPTEGFTVIATANTKGQGSDDGRFIGTNVLNEAFLERFPVTIEQSYPTAKMETKILDNELGKHGLEDNEFSTNLVKWADVIRKTFYEGGVDEIISTRRLVHIVGAFSIFKDKTKAIELTVNRFDDETKESFLDLYTKIDAGIDPDVIGQSDTDDANEEDIPF